MSRRSWCVTHRGLYQYQRMPFGVKSAPSIFQKLMDTLLAGIPGVFTYLDDLVIATSTVEDQLQALSQVFAKLQNFGLKLQLDKCNLFVKSLEFLGHIVDENGIWPNPKRTLAVREMPQPKDVTGVRAFLGAINFYGKYIREMRDLRTPLDALLKKISDFNLSSDCQQAFVKAKKIICSDLLLAHYDPLKPIVVAAAASKNEIGATISHVMPDGPQKVVKHAARTLTAAEQNYG